jgi:hypothetical protein
VGYRVRCAVELGCVWCQDRWSVMRDEGMCWCGVWKRIIVGVTVASSASQLIQGQSIIAVKDIHVEVNE